MGATLAAYYSNLKGKVAFHHFCYSLLATKTNPSATRQRTTQG